MNILKKSPKVSVLLDLVRYNMDIIEALLVSLIGSMILYGGLLGHTFCSTEMYRKYKTMWVVIAVIGSIILVTPAVYAFVMW